MPKRTQKASQSKPNPSTLVGVFRPRHGGGLPPPTPSAGHFRRICGETLKKSRPKPPFRKTLEPHPRVLQVLRQFGYVFHFPSYFSVILVDQAGARPTFVKYEGLASRARPDLVKYEGLATRARTDLVKYEG